LHWVLLPTEELLKPASECAHVHLLRRLSWSWTLLLPSDTYRQPSMSITGVLLPFVMYFLTLLHIWFEAFMVTVYSEVSLCDQPCGGRAVCPVFQRLSLSPSSGVDTMTALCITIVCGQNAYQMRQRQCLKYQTLSTLTWLITCPLYGTTVVKLVKALCY
jgi:hypothetical protein